MILFPAIDILNGRAVRLLYGDYAKVTDYGDPVETALKWESQGAQFLHIVDLDGARAGAAVNSEVIAQIIKRVKIPVQSGGGIRDMQAVERSLSVGIARVILGTAFCKNPEIAEKAAREFGARRLVCSIDARGGMAAVEGWTQSGGVSAVELGQAVKRAGIEFAVYTDISRDGALKGVNVSGCARIARETGLNIIASGGVSGLNDLKLLKRERVYGAILGRAIYENKFSVSDALKIESTFIA
jgi:phosphoribosylformimino-5-aminoimidazole carboxamide ribotide isomerase